MIATKKVNASEREAGDWDFRRLVAKAKAFALPADFAKHASPAELFHGFRNQSELARALGATQLERGKPAGAPRTSHAPLTVWEALIGADRPWMPLRHADGTMFNLLTGAGCLLGPSPALASLFQDAQVAGGLARTKRLFVVPTVADAGFLRALGLPAVTYPLLDRITSGELRTALTVMHQAMYCDALPSQSIDPPPRSNSRRESPEARGQPSASPSVGAAAKLESTARLDQQPSAPPQDQKLDDATEAVEFDYFVDEPSSTGHGCGFLANDWLVVLAWSPTTPAVHEQPGCEALLAHLTTLIRHLGLDAAGIGVWRLTPDDLEAYCAKARFGDAALLTAFFLKHSGGRFQRFVEPPRPVVLSLADSERAYHDALHSQVYSEPTIRRARDAKRQSLHAHLIQPLFDEAGTAIRVDQKLVCLELAALLADQFNEIDDERERIARREQGYTVYPISPQQLKTHHQIKQSRLANIKMFLELKAWMSPHGQKVVAPLRPHKSSKS